MSSTKKRSILWPANSDDDDDDGPQVFVVPPEKQPKSRETKPVKSHKEEKLYKPTAELLKMPENIFEDLQSETLWGLRTAQLRKYRGNELDKQKYELIDNLARTSGVESFYTRGLAERPEMWLYPDGTVQLRQGNTRCEWLYRNGYVWMAVRVVVKDFRDLPRTKAKCKPTKNLNSKTAELLKNMQEHLNKEFFQSNIRLALYDWLGLEVLDVNKGYTKKDFKTKKKEGPINYTYSVWHKQCTELGCEQKAQWQCSECNTALYCSRECQKKDWVQTHAKECK